MLTIRELEKKDIEVITNQEVEMFNFTLGEKHFLDAIDSDISMYYVLDLDGFVIGYIGTVLNGEYAQVLNFYILSVFQQKGYAKKLLYFTIEELYKLGVHEITLEVRKSNIPAFKLYAGAGFNIGYTREKYYDDKEDALVLIKQVNK